MSKFISVMIVTVAFMMISSCSSDDDQGLQNEEQESDISEEQKRRYVERSSQLAIRILKNGTRGYQNLKEALQDSEHLLLVAPIGPSVTWQWEIEVYSEDGSPIRSRIQPPRGALKSPWTSQGPNRFSATKTRREDRFLAGLPDRGTFIFEAIDIEACRDSIPSGDCEDENSFPDFLIRDVSIDYIFIQEDALKCIGLNELLDELTNEARGGRNRDSRDNELIDALGRWVGYQEDCDQQGR